MEGSGQRSELLATAVFRITHLLPVYRPHRPIAAQTKRTPRARA